MYILIVSIYIYIYILWYTISVLLSLSAPQKGATAPLQWLQESCPGDCGDWGFTRLSLAGGYWIYIYIHMIYIYIYIHDMIWYDMIWYDIIWYDIYIYMHIYIYMPYIYIYIWYQGARDETRITQLWPSDGTPDSVVNPGIPLGSCHAGYPKKHSDPMCPWFWHQKTR